MSTQQVNELSLASIVAAPAAETEYAPEASYADQAAMVMAPAGGETTSSGSMAIGDPVKAVPARNVTVYANQITPVSYSNDEGGVACFDVVFSVGISCEEGSKTYQIVKRIGIDKMKIASEAEAGSPVSIVEGTETDDSKLKKLEAEVKKLEADWKSNKGYDNFPTARHDATAKLDKAKKAVADHKKSMKTESVDTATAQPMITEAKRFRRLAGLE